MKTTKTLADTAPISDAHQPGRDPLKNTKKLAVAGHTTLYNDGAFEILTTIHIVPPGPGTFALALQMAGGRARRSFEESIARARESVSLARAGMKITRNIAVALQQGTSDIASGARAVTRFGTRMAGSSLRRIRSTVNASRTYSSKVFHSTMQAGDELARGSLLAGGAISKGTSNTLARMWAATIHLARRTAQASRRASRRHAADAREQFVKDYAALPAKFGEHLKNIAECVSPRKFIGVYQNANRKRAGLSRELSHLFVDTIRGNHYTNDIKTSFRKARSELSAQHDTGYTFALLKALRWIMQGILWDAAIKPVVKMTGALLGYAIVNIVIFPVRLALNASVAVILAAVQAISNSVVLVYEIIVPSASAAAVGLFSVVVLIGGQLLAGGELLVGAVATAGTYVVGKMTAVVIASGGYVVGKIVQYVGAPLFTVCIAVGGSMFGVVVGAATAVAGSLIVIAGVTGEMITQITGHVAAGSVLVGGFIAAVIAGAVLGAYELIKAVVVPVIYELGAGLIIIYSILLQLSAHVVLAVADVAYLLLSLEGARWVLHLVKGDRYASGK